MKASSWLKVSIMLAVLALGIFPAVAQDNAGDNSTQYVGDPAYPAPDFPTGLDWINVANPLTLEDLRGKVVVLDFWTYGCINCIHMIPILHELEAKYGDALAVIGVHSAKFANEGQTENIRQIVQRYGLEHPVINDKDFEVWQTYAPYGVQAWPTFVVIDPRGNMLAVQAGEIPIEAFDKVVGGMIGYFDSVNEIKRDPLPIRLESASTLPAALNFPGKVMVDTAGNRLFIADSSHNRIVISDLTSNEVLDVAGTGEAGLDNGSFDEATFAKPQGMAIRENILYVADTDNHEIRALDLTARTVSTFAGTGKQGYNRSESGLPLTSDLSSPWDVEFDDKDNLYIAMAGTHQIWVLSFSINSVGPLIGTGQEGLKDGAFTEAQLAQPSGLFFRDGNLYFADSESSSIRVAELAGGTVTTLAGPDANDLFDFGDKDGAFGTSRLQHALGVTGAADGLLYVADTYNSKIKVLDPDKKEITTLMGQGGTGGFHDGSATDAQFDEPGGLDFANGKLFIADTNNDAVRVIDVAANTVSTITFPNPEALQISDQVTVVGGNSAQGEVLNLPEQTVQQGNGEIVLNINLPEGYKLNGLAPFSAEWSTTGTLSLDAADQAQSVVAPELPVRVPITASGDGTATLTGNLMIYYCEAVKESLCFIDRVTVNVPVTVSASASGNQIEIARDITPPQVPLGSGF